MRYFLLLLSFFSIFSAHAADCSSGEDCYQKADAAVLAKQFEQAFAYAQKSCAFDYVQGCTAEAIFYREGIAVEKNMTKFIELSEKSCLLGDNDACALLASAYLNAQQGLAANPEKAFAMATQGCSQAHDLSCMLLGALYIQGKGTEQNIIKGEALLAQACQLSPDIICPRVERLRSEFKAQGILP